MHRILKLRQLRQDLLAEEKREKREESSRALASLLRQTAVSEHKIDSHPLITLHKVPLVSSIFVDCPPPITVL